MSARRAFTKKLGGDDKILSSLINKAWCTFIFLTYFREAIEQLL